MILDETIASTIQGTQPGVVHQHDQGHLTEL
jgi:hypothetical protein